MKVECYTISCMYFRSAKLALAPTLTLIPNISNESFHRFHHTKTNRCLHFTTPATNYWRRDSLAQRSNHVYFHLFAKWMAISCKHGSTSAFLLNRLLRVIPIGKTELYHHWTTWISEPMPCTLPNLASIYLCRRWWCYQCNSVCSLYVNDHEDDDGVSTTWYTQPHYVQHAITPILPIFSSILFLNKNTHYNSINSKRNKK